LRNKVRPVNKNKNTIRITKSNAKTEAKTSLKLCKSTSESSKG
jgi:hypothetical protein